jgi:AcrR family transcriptional regulator
MYKKPLQPRAIATEQKFLDALNFLLKEKSLGQLSIDEIADQAQLTRGAFLKRFGSKKQALFVLWALYCTRASEEMVAIAASLSGFASVEDACMHMSKRLEHIQTLEFSTNRAMHEDFQENLRIDPQTKKIFLDCVDLMRQVQKQFSLDTTGSDAGAFAAAQLLITINYNYVLKAMPALPINWQARHKLIGDVVALALKS